MNAGPIIKVSLSPETSETLWRLVREAQAEDALAPVTIVGPTRYCNFALRHELGRRGFANVRFIIMSQLSELLGAGMLAQRRSGKTGPDPMTQVIEAISVNEALQQTSTSLSPVSGHLATQSRVRFCFREFRRADEEVLTALANQGGVPSDVVRLYRDFREITSDKWYDSEDLAQAAVNALQSGDTPALEDLGLIVVYLPKDPSPWETLLIRALVEKGNCAVILGNAEDPVVSQRVDALAETLAQGLGSTGISAVSGPSAGTGQTRIHVSPTAREEVRHVVRGIMTEAQRNGTPFRRMAVLYRAREPYASLIPHELTEAGIPIAGPGARLLRDTAPGRTLLGLLDLADAEFPRAQVMAWLTGCPVRYGDSAADFNPSAWDSLTRRAGIVGGLSQWKSRLEHYARQTQSEARWRLENGEITEARAKLQYREAEDARALLKFFDDLGSRLVPPSDGSPWEQFSDWGLGLLQYYLDDKIPPNEAAALEKVNAALEEMKAADDVDRSTTLAEFRQVLHHALQNSTGRLGDTDRGVFVSSFASAAGLAFDVVWMVGMVEGVVPPATPPDPLVPEYNWLNAGGASRTSRRMSQERGEFLSALNSAKRRILSYPEAGTSSNRKAYPSRWLLEQASTLANATVHSDDLAGLVSQEWLTINPSPQSALSSIHEDESLADLHDYTLHRLLGWRLEGNRQSSHPLARDGLLARASNLRSRRQHRQLTEFDGNLSTVTGSAQFAHSLTETPISPTRLENWAQCPFRYFMSHVLRLSALDTPEDILSINPMDRGSLVHKILERFITEAGGPPSPSQHWPDSAHTILLQIAEEEFRNEERRGVTGKRVLWEGIKEDILIDLDTFLEEDAKLRRKHGSTSIKAESSFGMGANAPNVVEPRTKTRFRGLIDRIDVTADGKSILVTDYKTGGYKYYEDLKNDPIGKGKRLQLGVYSLAARALFPEAKRVEAQYWFPTDKGEFKRFPGSPFNIDNPKTLDRFQDGISTIVDGITGGVFPANPGSDNSYTSNCHFCDFDPVCPSRRFDLWEAKKHDPLVAKYLALAEDEWEAE